MELGLLRVNGIDRYLNAEYAFDLSIFQSDFYNDSKSMMTDAQAGSMTLDQQSQFNDIVLKLDYSNMFISSQYMSIFQLVQKGREHDYEIIV